MEKKAIEIQEGDVLTGRGSGGVGAHYGEVANVVVVDSGVQINFKEGGYVIRPEDELLEVVG